MKTVNFNVWGCSDDLIEITGDIEAEFPGYGAGEIVLMSDGTELEVIYDNDGNWRFLVNELGKDTSIISHRHGSEDAKRITDGRDYTDVAEVNGNIEWVVVTQQVARPTE